MVFLSSALQGTEDFLFILFPHRSFGSKMKLRRRSYLDPSQVLRSRPEVVHVGSLVLAPRRAMNFIALLGFAGVDIKQLERERERDLYYPSLFNFR